MMCPPTKKNFLFFYFRVLKNHIRIYHACLQLNTSFCQKVTEQHLNTQRLRSEIIILCTDETNELSCKSMNLGFSSPALRREPSPSKAKNCAGWWSDCWLGVFFLRDLEKHFYVCYFMTSCGQYLSSVGRTYNPFTYTFTLSHDFETWVDFMKKYFPHKNRFNISTLTLD